MLCTDKVRYISRHMAKRSAKIVKAAGGNLKGYTYETTLRPYLCPICNLWHLTHNKKHQ